MNRYSPLEAYEVMLNNLHGDTIKENFVKHVDRDFFNAAITDFQIETNGVSLCTASEFEEELPIIIENSQRKYKSFMICYIRDSFVNLMLYKGKEYFYIVKFMQKQYTTIKCQEVFEQDGFIKLTM